MWLKCYIALVFVTRALVVYLVMLPSNKGDIRHVANPLDSLDLRCESAVLATYNSVCSGRSRWASGVSTEAPFQILKKPSVYNLYLMFMDSAT